MHLPMPAHFATFPPRTITVVCDVGVHVGVARTRTAHVACAPIRSSHKGTHCCTPCSKNHRSSMVCEARCAVSVRDGGQLTLNYSQEDMDAVRALIAMTMCSTLPMLAE